MNKRISLLAALGLLVESGGGLCSTERVAADLPQLASACRSLQDYLVSNCILVGSNQLGVESSSFCFPFPASWRVTAYEENTNFIYACGQPSNTVATDIPKARWVRRFICLLPGVFVLDDWVQPQATNVLVRWALSWRTQPTLLPRQLRLRSQDQELVCETLWPPNKTLRPASANVRADFSAPVFDLEQETTSNGVRFVHLFDLRRSSCSNSGPTTFWSKVLGALRPPQSNAPPVRASVESNQNGQLELVISTPDQVLRLGLPLPSAGAGWIANTNCDGYPVVRRRPLPSGILPHTLLDEWDGRFRDRSAFEWDIGKPALKLKQAVELGLIKPPCRVADIGCGSGNDAIYLASQGFDVTGIDIAPTGLSIAAEKAREAGVHVHWVLADALALPELGPFDFIFDRGCYHNVRYLDARAFVQSLDRISGVGGRCLILSLNKDGPPGVREHQMREDFLPSFEVERLEEGGIEDRAGNVCDSWSLWLRHSVPDSRMHSAR